MTTLSEQQMADMLFAFCEAVKASPLPEANKDTILAQFSFHVFPVASTLDGSQFFYVQATRPMPASQEELLELLADGHKTMLREHLFNAAERHILSRAFSAAQAAAQKKRGPDFI